MKPGSRHRNHVPRVRGPFVAPQGLGALPLTSVPEVVLTDVSLNGTSVGEGESFGDPVARWALAGDTAGAGLTGDVLYPQALLAPSSSLFPGSAGAKLSVKWALGGVSSGTSTTRAGVTSLGGTMASNSAMGFAQLPGSSTLPSSALFPGVHTTDLTVVHDSNVVLAGASVGGAASLGDLAGGTVAVVVSVAIHAREKPPLRMHIDIETPGGRHYRWGPDEPSPANVPTGLRFSDTMPGGFETADCTLPRKPGIDYSDLERLSDIRVLGTGGEVCWQGRLERAPRTSGDEVSVSPSAVGHQAALDDDKSAREIYVDVDMSHWQGPTTTRSAQLLALTPSETGSQWNVSVEGDTVTGLPAVHHSSDRLFGDAAVRGRAESWYDGNGIPIGAISYELVCVNLGNGADANWATAVLLATEPTAVSFDTGTDHNGANGPTAGNLAATTSTRRYAILLTQYGANFGPLDSHWDAYWRKVGVYGNHGLAGHGAAAPFGLYASDIVRHAVQTFAPSLLVKSDSIQQSSFVVPHLVFLEPTTCSEIVRQASRFNLPDWAVWDDKEFVWHEPGARGRTWRLRIGPSQLEETGPQVDRLWESVIVSYQDVDGSTRTVGPPGSGADTESSDLKDLDPENPANKLGITRRELLSMGTSTAAGATEVGRRFLEQSKLLDRSGKARVVGWAEDDRGVLHPFSAVRAGDYAVFVDASDTSARKIIRTEKSYDDRTCTLDLDAPPEGLQQLLERLGVVLVGIGL